MWLFSQPLVFPVADRLQFIKFLAQLTGLGEKVDVVKDWG